MIRGRAVLGNDNGLVETKNGAIVRKHLGYSPIPQRYAREVNAFCREFLNPYVNFHRPCFFAESFTDDKGKTRKRYLLKNRMTPYEKLKSLPNAKRFLKSSLTFKQLDQTAKGINDNEAARRLNGHETTLPNPSTIDPNVQPETYLLLPSFRLKPKLELTDWSID